LEIGHRKVREMGTYVFACSISSCVTDGHRLITSDLSGNACNRLSKKLRTFVVGASRGDGDMS